MRKAKTEANTEYCVHVFRKSIDNLSKKAPHPRSLTRNDLAQLQENRQRGLYFILVVFVVCAIG